MTKETITTGKDGKSYYGKGTKGGKAPEAKTPSTDINSVSFDKAETNNFVRPKVGDILCSMWGYDKTNVSFYRVSSLNGNSMLTLEKLEVKFDGAQGFWAEEVSPGDKVMISENQDNGVKGPIVSEYDIQIEGNSFYVKISNYECAYPWKGSLFERVRPKDNSWKGG